MKGVGGADRQALYTSAYVKLNGELPGGVPPFQVKAGVEGVVPVKVTVPLVPAGTRNGSDMATGPPQPLMPLSAYSTIHTPLHEVLL